MSYCSERNNVDCDCCNIIQRGTTARNTFEVEKDLTDASEIYVSYEQSGKVVVEKTLENGVSIVSEEQITVDLTQDDTLALNEHYPVKMQIRAKFPSGSAVASFTMSASVGEILKEGAI